MYSELATALMNHPRNRNNGNGVIFPLLDGVETTGKKVKFELLFREGFLRRSDAGINRGERLCDVRNTHTRYADGIAGFAAGPDLASGFDRPM